MRLPLVILLGLGIMKGTFGQHIPVPIVSGHPFSADEVISKGLRPMCETCRPRRPSGFIGTQQAGPELTRRLRLTRSPLISRLSTILSRVFNILSI